MFQLSLPSRLNINSSFDGIKLNRNPRSTPHTTASDSFPFWLSNVTSSILLKSLCCFFFFDGLIETTMNEKTQEIRSTFAFEKSNFLFPLKLYSSACVKVALSSLVVLGDLYVKKA
jgi:hypothetical protein